MGPKRRKGQKENTPKSPAQQRANAISKKRMKNLHALSVQNKCTGQSDTQTHAHNAASASGSN